MNDAVVIKISINLTARNFLAKTETNNFFNLYEYLYEIASINSVFISFNLKKCNPIAQCCQSCPRSCESASKIEYAKTFGLRDTTSFVFISEKQFAENLDSKFFQNLYSQT